LDGSALRWTEEVTAVHHPTQGKILLMRDFLLLYRRRWT
jgi:hypothetical protein